MTVVPMPKFIAAIMVFSIACFVLFGFIYMGMGMEKHFNIGNVRASNASHAFYHSWCVQTTSMDEMAPKTLNGRIAQATQAALAWLPMIVLLAPWNVT